MKVFILIILLLIVHRIEKQYTDQIYNITDNFCYHLPVLSKTQNKQGVLKIMYSSIKTIDSAAYEFKNIQHINTCMRVRFAKYYAYASQYYPLVYYINIYHFQSMAGIIQTTYTDGSILATSSDRCGKIFRWIFRQVKKRIHR